LAAFTIISARALEISPCQIWIHFPSLVRNWEVT
jgi:hypothetical protein